MREKLLQTFLYSLLGKRRPRMMLLIRWHARSASIEGRNVEEVAWNFIHTILYEPLAFSLHSEHIKLFNIPGLYIPYAWLNPGQLHFIKQVYLRRDLGGGGRLERYAAGGFSLKNLFPGEDIKLAWRRELVRDFVWLFLSRKDLPGHDLFLYIFQRMLLEENVDRFVVEMHEALQGRANPREVLCIYP